MRVIRVFPRATVQEHLNNHPEWNPNRAKSLDPELQLLACQIETTALARIAGDFTAISYTAGDLSDTKLMLVNGIPFNAFTNLEHAITYTLAHQNRMNNIKSSSSDKLWVDQICINQSDKKELGQQVQFMREIYRQSEQTIVCLSTPQMKDCLLWIPQIPKAVMQQKEETPDVAALKKFILDLLGGTGEFSSSLSSLPPLSTRANSHSPRTGTTCDIPQRASTIDGGSSRAFPLIRGHPISSRQNTLNSGIDTIDKKALTSLDGLQSSLKTFLVNPWWKRSWVYQEFISGTSVQFISGSVSASWAEMASLTNFVCDGLIPFLQNIQDELQSKIIEEMEEKEDERRADSLRRKQAREKALQESEFRRHKEEMNNRFKQKERSLAESKERHRRSKEKEWQQWISESDRAAQMKYQRHLEEYHKAVDVFNNTKQQQWAAARKAQSERRDRFQSEEKLKVQNEIEYLRRRIDALNNISQLRQRRYLRREETKLERFWYEINQSIEDQIKVAWGLRKDTTPERDVKINKECGGRLFATGRIEALINLDQVTASSADFQPVDLERPVPPTKPAPKQSIDFWKMAQTVSSQSGDNGLRYPRSVQSQSLETTQSQALLRPAPFVMPPRVSSFSYLIEDCEDTSEDDVNTSDHNEDRVQGRRERRNVEAGGAPEIKPPSGLKIPGSSRAQRHEAITSFQHKFMEIDKSAVKSMIKGKQTFKRSSDLKALLQHSRSCQSSDPRDRVYAFLGLAHQGYDIIPNYEPQNGIREVLIEAAKAIIRFDKSLDILQHVHRGRDKLGAQLPSWVPDWTSEEIPMEPHKESEELHCFDASKGLPMDVEFGSATGDNDYQDLKVRGVFLDYIEEVRSESPIPSGVTSFLTTQGQLSVVGPSSARTDDEVWILYGCRKPSVLRRSGSNCQAYLGDVILYNEDKSPSNIMFGKIADQVRDGTVGAGREKVIWIM